MIKHYDVHAVLFEIGDLFGSKQCRNRGHEQLRSMPLETTRDAFPAQPVALLPCATARTAPAPRRKRTMFQPARPMRSRHRHRNPGNKTMRFAPIQCEEDARDGGPHLRQRKRIAQGAKTRTEEIRTSQALRKPFRKSNRAMHSDAQISLHGIAPPVRSRTVVRSIDVAPISLFTP